MNPTDRLPPPTFTDARGRSWRVEVTAAVLDQVLAATGVDLAAVVMSGGNPVFELGTPIDRLFLALRVVLAPQLRAAGIGRREFFPTLFTSPPGPGARRRGRDCGAFSEPAAMGAGQALCRGLAALYPGTAFARAVALDAARPRPHHAPHG